MYTNTSGWGERFAPLDHNIIGMAIYVAVFQFNLPSQHYSNHE